MLLFIVPCGFILCFFRIIFLHVLFDPKYVAFVQLSCYNIVEYIRCSVYLPDIM